MGADLGRIGWGLGKKGRKRQEEADRKRWFGMRRPFVRSLAMRFLRWSCPAGFVFASLSEPDGACWWFGDLRVASLDNTKPGLCWFLGEGPSVSKSVQVFFESRSACKNWADNTGKTEMWRPPGQGLQLVPDCNPDVRGG